MLIYYNSKRNGVDLRLLKGMWEIYRRTLSCLFFCLMFRFFVILMDLKIFECVIGSS